MQNVEHYILFENTIQENKPSNKINKYNLYYVNKYT